MTREELLQKCLDRGVADETTIGAVSHLFYVFLLSALQRGQRVEIPNFGTFGTKVIGAKRSRKMPFFQPDTELADRVNDRYRSLKYVVVGTYKELPAVGDTEYRGKEAPADVLTDQVGKELVLDTSHDVTPDQHEEAIAQQRQKPTKETSPMPKFNLKEEEPGEQPLKEEVPPAPLLREMERESKGPGPLVQVFIAIVFLGLLTFALHYFGVIRLWGPERPATPGLPEPAPVQITPEAEPPVSAAEPTPLPTAEPPAIKPAMPPSGSGEFTVQVSSWLSRAKADEEVSRLIGANLEAFVETANVDGVQRHRVRVGRYATRQDANVAAQRLGEILENGAWVARIGS